MISLATGAIGLILLLLPLAPRQPRGAWPWPLSAVRALHGLFGALGAATAVVETGCQLMTSRTHGAARAGERAVAGARAPRTAPRARMSERREEAVRGSVGRSNATNTLVFGAARRSRRSAGRDSV